jgi:hypothetical protein
MKDINNNVPLTSDEYVFFYIPQAQIYMINDIGLCLILNPLWKTYAGRSSVWSEIISTLSIGAEYFESSGMEVFDELTICWSPSKETAAIEETHWAQ